MARWNPRDLTGERFGRLTVVKKSDKKYKGDAHQFWFCHCDCGKEKEIYDRSLITGSTKSCGCLGREISSINGSGNRKHGMSFSPEYYSWNHMMMRCTNKNHHAWKDYGGRGITVCERWKSFENFYEDMGERPIGKSIDRIDNDGNYEPKNCKWSTQKEQVGNRRNSNHLIEYNREIKLSSVWEEEYGLNAGILIRRIRSGWSVDRAINTPMYLTKRIVYLNGELKSVRDLERSFGLSIGMLGKRLRKGINIESAIKECGIEI